ncbi:hypothetical protein Q1M63_24265 [Sinorhizobium meliloti]|nr:hypothetical protein Q1M63_24265 [Sinorhizobium meliloti]
MLGEIEFVRNLADGAESIRAFFSMWSHLHKALAGQDRRRDARIVVR